MSLDPARPGLAMAPMANAIRALSMDAVQAANSGHPGMPMGMADVATVLWSKYLKFDASAPDWADRDRFVLSAGHGSMLIYSLLYLSGYKSPTMVASSSPSLSGIRPYERCRRIRRIAANPGLRSPS